MGRCTEKECEGKDVKKRILWEKIDREKVIKGVQAWEFLLKEFYTIIAYLSGRLQDWKKKLGWRSCLIYFQHTLNDFKHMLSLRRIF